MIEGTLLPPNTIINNTLILTKQLICYYNLRGAKRMGCRMFHSRHSDVFVVTSVSHGRREKTRS